MHQFIDIKHHYKILSVCLLLILTILIAYWQVKNFDFVNLDDLGYVAANPKVQSGLTIDGIAWAFSFTDIAYWHPLTWLSHMLDCDLYGLNPMGHHWTSLQIHIANTLLLFFILQYMTKALWKSAFVAALFALHPINVESVAWVAERKNVLSTFFWMLTMLAYVHYTTRPSLYRYLLTLFFLMLGLMAKPMLVTLPFVLLLIDYWTLERLRHQSPFNLILEKIPFFALSAVSAYISSLSVHRYEIVVSMELVPMKLRVANALVSYVKYIEKMIWPKNLAVFYPFPDTLPVWQVFGACLFLASISFLVLLNLRKKPYLCIGWLWFLGTLIPVIGLKQAGLWPAMADRWAYVPLVGIFIIVAWGGSDLLKKWTNKKIVPAILAISVLLVLTTQSFHQASHWKNNITLFENAVKATDHNWLAYNDLGLALMHKGKLNDAVFHFKKALQIRPKYLTAIDNLGMTLHRLGRFEEACNYYMKALKIDPKHAGIHNNTANILTALGKLEEAIKHYRKAILITPDFAEPHYNLANILVIQKKFDEAVFHYESAIKNDSEYSDAYYNLGCILLRQKKFKEALVNFTQAVKINPDYKQAYNQIGIILLQRGKIKKAEKFFSKAVQIDPGYKEAISNLLILEQMTQQDGK